MKCVFVGFQPTDCEQPERPEMNGDKETVD